MKYIIKKVLFVLPFIVLPYIMQAEQFQEDDFLADLLRVSEEIEQESDEMNETVQAFACMEQARKENLEQSSMVRRYATVLALKALGLYGSCAHYVKQWIDYITSFVYSPYHDK